VTIAQSIASGISSPIAQGIVASSEPDWSSFGTIVANWDASDTSTISVASSVMTWTDKVGSVGVSNTGAGDLPSTGTRTVNGLNVLDFDGSDQLFGSITQAQPSVIVAVFQLDSVASTQNIIDSNTSGARQSFGTNATPQWFQFAGTTQTGGTSDTNLHTAISFYNAGFSFLEIDEVAVISANSGSQTLNGITIGARHDGANGMNGALCQVLVYSGTLANKAGVYSGTSAKWGA